MPSSLMDRVLRAPLATKLVGAKVVVISTFVGLSLVFGWRPADGTQPIVLGIAAACSLLVTVGLVILALRPLLLLEDTARRVWDGDYAARVPRSRLADAPMQQLTSTFNTLLDRLTTDRARVRELATELIRSSDEERSRAAFQLHESAAQTIASISWQLGVFAHDAGDPELEQRLQMLKREVDGVLEDVRRLAEAMHPRILQDLGLAAALAQFARQVQAETSVCIVAEVDRAASANIDPRVAATFYGVAQEAVWNALKHANPHTVTIRLFANRWATLLEVIDDGNGFDVKYAERAHCGRGIFSMRERVGLVNAHLTLESEAGGGTKVCAYIHRHSAMPEISA
ncbi:MAG: sensor histidine kinase [Gemmatimonadaceae bacterium]